MPDNMGKDGQEALHMKVLRKKRGGTTNNNGLRGLPIQGDRNLSSCSVYSAYVWASLLVVWCAHYWDQEPGVYGPGLFGLKRS